MSRLRELKTMFSILLVVLNFLNAPARADDEPWPLPVGVHIMIQEYLSPYDGGPHGVWNTFVTDRASWWKLDFGSPVDYSWLVRYDLLTGSEEEFRFDYRIREFVVTADDNDLFYTCSDSPPCTYGMDCLYHFHVLSQVNELIWQSGPVLPMWSPDIDGEWLVWSEYSSGPYVLYLMNWEQDGEPILLDPDGDYPRISYPWAAWKDYGEAGGFARAYNLQTGETVVTDSVFREPEVDNSLLFYAVGEYLLSHLFVCNLYDSCGEAYQISWDNGVEEPRAHNELVVWDYYDGATGRSAIQGRDLDTGLTFDIGVRGGMHSYDVRNNIVAWADRTYYPEAQVFIMLTRPYPQRGDMNGDNVVNIVDIMLVASHWRDAEGDPGYDKGWDLNWDGRVDIVDIMLVAKHWGETWSPAE